MTQTMEYRLSGHERAQCLEYAGGKVNVWSRSGLNFTEKALLDHWEEWKPVARVLILENRTGVLASFRKHLHPDTEVSLHGLDCFYTRKLQDLLDEHGMAKKIKVTLSPDLPLEVEGYDEIFLQVSQSLSAEMVSDYLQQIHQRLKVGGRCWVGAEKRHKTAASQVKKTFGASTEYHYRFGSVMVAKKTGELKRIKEHKAQFEVPLGEGQFLAVTTCPGIFSHRRPDDGALALLDTVEVKAGDTLLEMGCGSGLVALGLQKRQPEIKVSLLDSHTRALEMSRFNATQNNLPEPQLQCSSQGWQGEAKFDVFVGNPPYFGDHQISALFMDTAARVLKPNGVMWIVAKSMDWNWEYAQANFKNCELFSRRGYQVMKAVK
jgi:16S rRNA (guanine1207-N2)-methyltransferase